MKISVYDSWNKKFSGPIAEHWEAMGHEVVFNKQYDEPADIAFYYQSDNVAVDGVPKTINAKRIFVQVVDIECWAGQAYAVDWTKVDGCIFMAQHIKDMVEGSTPSILDIPRKIIKPGIDTQKFYQRPPVQFSEAPIRKIAYVVGDRRIWDVKRLDIAFQLLRDLMDTTDKIWQLHVRGTYSTHQQYNAYCKHLEKDLKLSGNVVWEEARVEDLSAWLDDKDYFLLPSTKEVFSYATAEAMSKGIKPIIGNWQSAKDTWGEFVCETYGQMLAELTKGKYEPDKYRKYIVENYEQERYLKQIDEFIGL